MITIATSWPQVSLAGAFAASALGSYFALCQPNPNPSKSTTDDSLHGLLLTHAHSTKVAMTPLSFLSLHACGLALAHPGAPTWLIGHGLRNGLNPDLVTWSPSTAIPLALLLGAGIPLRLMAYSTLGRNFTFALAQPDGLNTTGIYRYVQHPSYTGLTLLIWANMALLGRIDGPLSCITPPSLYGFLQTLQWWLTPVIFSAFASLMWTRVMQEERMLHEQFGEEWLRWHRKTARFIPGII